MSTFAERAADISNRLEEPLPESWIPETAGDKLVGTFVRLEKGSTAYGPAWIVVLETDSGERRSVWLINQALRTEFARIRPTPGELVGVLYGGKKPVKNPQQGRAKEYHDWRVIVDREQATVDWNVLGGEPIIEEPIDADFAVGGDDSIPF